MLKVITPQHANNPQSQNYNKKKWIALNLQRILFPQELYSSNLKRKKKKKKESSKQVQVAALEKVIHTLSYPLSSILKKYGPSDNLLWVVLGVDKHERKTREFCPLSLYPLTLSLPFSSLFLSSFSCASLHQAFSMFYFGPNYNEYVINITEHTSIGRVND